VAVLKGRLGPETEVLVKPTSVHVGLGHKANDGLAAQLFKRIPEAGVEIGSVEPPAARDCCYVHPHTGAVPPLKDHACNQLPTQVAEANRLPTTRNPFPSNTVSNPPTDEVSVGLKALTRGPLHTRRGSLLQTTRQ